MFRIYYTIFMLLNISCFVSNMKIPIRYSSYKNIRPIFFDIYKHEYNINSLNEFNNYSIEHIIPRSLYKNNTYLKNDMHNIILYPNKINLHRSNYKYVSDFKIYHDSQILDEYGNKIVYENPLVEDKIMIKTNKNKSFYPSKQYRGPIARSAMYFITTYPEYQNDILTNVINPYTILTWHYQNPVSYIEMIKNRIIKEHQGNDNLFILEKKLLAYEMEKILGKSLSNFY